MPVRRKTFSSRLPDETVKALRHLGVDLDRSVEDLLKEAIGDLLNKYKKPRRKKRPYLEL